MANPESDDRDSRARRRRRSEIGSQEAPYKSRGDIEDPQTPTLAELRSIRTDHYSGGSMKRSAVPASRMVRSSVSRSSFSGTKSTSRHRHKSAHTHRSETDTIQHRKSKLGSNNDVSPPAYVYDTSRPRKRSSVIEVTERRGSGLDDDSGEDDATMSTISEEPGQVPVRKTRKVKVIYVKGDTYKASKHHASHRAFADDGKSFAKSVHRSRKTSSHRRTTSEPSRDSLHRYLVNVLLITEIHAKQSLSAGRNQYWMFENHDKPQKELILEATLFYHLKFYTKLPWHAAKILVCSRPFLPVLHHTRRKRSPSYCKTSITT
jgi:hypothetical protein